MCWLSMYIQIFKHEFQVYHVPHWAIHLLSSPRHLEMAIFHLVWWLSTEAGSFVYSCPLCEAICVDSLEQGMEDTKQTFRKSGHSFVLSLVWQHTTQLLKQLEQTQGQAQQSVDSIHQPSWFLSFNETQPGTAIYFRQSVCQVISQLWWLK